MPGQQEEIRRRFGDRVARIVDACTDTFEDPKPEWRRRKERYVEHLGAASADELLVACADKLYNARLLESMSCLRACARAVRECYGLSQSKFAALMGISVGTLRNWEQGRRRPEGSARVLLRVVDRHPEAVLDVVAALGEHGA